jgi:protocatechuate 3,4-dioxygenase beta subunit
MTSAHRFALVLLAVVVAALLVLVLLQEGGVGSRSLEQARRDDPREAAARLRGAPDAEAPQGPGETAPTGRTAADRGERSLAISGTVVGPDGSPQTDAFVVASRDGGSGVGTWTDREGRFRLQVRALGSWTLGVRDPFRGDVVHQETVPAGTEGVVLRLESALGGVMRVHVLDPEGEPVPAFHFLRSDGVQDGLATDGQRFVRVPVDGGPFFLEITHPRSADGTPLDLAPGSWGPITPRVGDMEVRLQPAASIAGRIVDDDGTPAEGAHVYAAPLDRGAAAGRSYGLHGNAHSDAEGRFRIGGLAARPYRLFLTAAGDSAHPEPVTVQGGAKNVEIRLEPGTSVEVVVLGPEGLPVEGAMLAAWRGMSFSNFVTDEEGRATIGRVGPTGVYSLRVTPPAARGDLAMLERHDWTVDETVLRLEAAGTLTGRVVDAQGIAVEGAQVSVVDAKGRSQQHLRTDVEGVFEARRLGAGPVHVRAVVPGTAACLHDVALDGREVELVLREEVDLEVELRGLPDDGGPVHATLRLHGFPWGGETKRHVGGTRIRFEALAPEASYALYVVAGEGEAVRAAWIPAFRGAAGTVRATLEPAGVLEGRIEGVTGREPARVEVAELGPLTKGVVHPDGRVRIGGIPPGTWTVVARTADFGVPLVGRTSARPGEAFTLPMRRRGSAGD